MPPCSTRDSRTPPTCTCLLEAYRTFPVESQVSKGCDAPDCPVRNLDGITLHQFMEAIGGPGGGIDLRDRAGRVGGGDDSPIFRALARRHKQRKSRPEVD